MLLEGASEGFDPREVVADLAQSISGVVRVHHVHAWSITQERPMVMLEAEVALGADSEAASRSIKSRLSSRFGNGHATVEVQEAGTATEPHGAAPEVTR